MSEKIVVNPTLVFICVFVFDFALLVGGLILMAMKAVDIPTFEWLVAMAVGFLGHLFAGYTGGKPYVPPPVHE